jgi:hypothetical protein
MKSYFNILGKVLFIANSNPGALACKSYFYTVKNKILLKYGEKIGFDLQHIEGKKCYACGGSGTYVGYYWDTGTEWIDDCNKCFGGWYKAPCTYKLDKYRLGKNIFHMPVKTYFFNEGAPEEGKLSDIKGYINHYNEITGKQSREAILWLILLFNFPQFKYFWKSAHLYFCYDHSKYPLTRLFILKAKWPDFKHSVKNIPCWIRNTIYFKFFYKEEDNFSDIADKESRY